MRAWQVEKDKDAEATKALARVLYDTALLESGFAIEQPKDFNARIHKLLAASLGIKGDLKVEAAPDEPEVTPCMCRHIAHPVLSCVHMITGLKLEAQVRGMQSIWDTGEQHSPGIIGACCKLVCSTSMASLHGGPCLGPPATAVKLSCRLQGLMRPLLHTD